MAQNLAAKAPLELADSYAQVGVSRGTRWRPGLGDPWPRPGCRLWLGGALRAAEQLSNQSEPAALPPPAGRPHAHPQLQQKHLTWSRDPWGQKQPGEHHGAEASGDAWALGLCGSPWVTENHAAEGGWGSQGCFLMKPHKTDVTVLILHRQTRLQGEKELPRFRPTRRHSHPAHNFVIPKCALLAR